MSVDAPDERSIAAARVKAGRHRVKLSKKKRAIGEEEGAPRGTAGENWTQAKLPPR